MANLNDLRGLFLPKQFYEPGGDDKPYNRANRAVNGKQERERPLAQGGEEEIELPVSGQTSHSLEKAMSHGLHFHSCQHRQVKGSPKCPSHAAFSELAGDSLQLCPGGTMIPETLMARVDESVQENKKVRSDPTDPSFLLNFLSLTKEDESI